MCDKCDSAERLAMIPEPAVQLRVAAAVAKEREECAKVAETFQRWGDAEKSPERIEANHASLMIADAIRSRGVLAP